MKAYGKKYNLSPGIVYVTGPYVEHEQIADEKEPMAEYCIYMQIGINGEKTDNAKPVMDAFEKRPFWIGIDRYGISEILTKIFCEIKNKNVGYRFQVNTLLQQIILCMVRNYEIESCNSPGLTHNNEIEMHYDPCLYIDTCFLYHYSDVSLESIAKAIGLSVRQTERLIKSHYGMTFREKKISARMSAAALMLTEESTSITKISERLGYSSVEHFGSAFKSYYGISPGKYRSSSI